MPYMIWLHPYFVPDTTLVAEDKLINKQSRLLLF